MGNLKNHFEINQLQQPCFRWRSKTSKKISMNQRVAESGIFQKNQFSFLLHGFIHRGALNKIILIKIRQIYPLFWKHV
jgi:hypothetical protein